MMPGTVVEPVDSADPVPPDGTVGNRAVAQARWIVLAPIAARVIGFGGTVVLARLLSPSEFGLMAYVGMVVTFFSLFQDLGISRALIARPGPVDTLLFPAFSMSLGSGLLFYALLAVVAHPFSAFVSEPRMVSMLWVMGAVIFLQTSVQVPQALLVRGEAYRTLFFIEVTQSLAFLAVAVSCAVAGRGVWSLVLGHVGAHAVRSGLLWSVGGWRPWRSGGSWISTEVLRFGGALTLVNLLDWGARALVYLFVGRSLGAGSLGVYRTSYEAARLSYFGLPALAGSVGLTGFAALASRPEEARRVILKGLRVAASTVFPVAVLVAVLAPWIVPLVWGEKWLGAIPILGILGFMGCAATIGQVCVPYLLGAGLLRPLVGAAAVNFAAYVAVVAVLRARGAGLETVAWSHLGLIAGVTALVGAFTLVHVRASPAGVARAVFGPALRAAIAGATALAIARSLGTRPDVLVVGVAGLGGALAYLALFRMTDPRGSRELTGVLTRALGGITS